MATAVDGVPDDDSEDTMRILLATDTHLGYMEKDAIRGNDSLVTFEEVLQLARKHDVDFILLGGDLFHDNKPSRRTLHGCISLLRKYCLGDRPCQVEFLSDQSINFGHTSFPSVNYEDANLNVAYPLFSIHGNHDDPAGQGNLCSLDLLSAAGLVNYFGKTSSLEDIEISPLLMQKGQTKLALYGLGAMRDERLHRLFVHKHVSMLRPREQRDDWFNMLVLHQNRAKHSATSYIPEQFLDAFLDLVFWGHEHECRIDPAWVAGSQEFYVTQPGSSIATSLSDGETRLKHVGVLRVHRRDFRIDKVALQTVRPFVLESIVLAETAMKPDDPDVARKVEAYCTERVDMMIERAERDHDGQQPALPLIRLRVDYSGGFDLFSIYRFGQKFVERVANPKDIILFHRRKMGTMKGRDHADGSDALPDIRTEALDSTRVEDMVKEYFSLVDKAQKLNLLSEKGMCDAVKEFVDKEERDAIGELFKHQLGKTQEYLKRRNTSEDVIEVEVERFADEQRTGGPGGGEVDSLLDMKNSLPPNGVPAPRARPRPAQTHSSDSTDSAVSGRGRGSRGGRGRKAAVVQEPPVNAIRDSFSCERRQLAAPASNICLKDDSDDDVILRSDSDVDMTYAPPSASRKRKQKSAPSSGRKGVSFSDSEDDDEPFSVPSSRRSRR